jgi:hypothetical protein
VFGERVDRGVTERRQVVRLPVVTPPVRHAGIEHALMLNVGLGLDQVDQRLGEGPQLGEHGFALGKVARVADRENHDRTAVQALGQKGRRRRFGQDDDGRELPSGTGSQARTLGGEVECAPRQRQVLEGRRLLANNCPWRCRWHSAAAGHGADPRLRPPTLRCDRRPSQNRFLVAARKG